MFDSTPQHDEQSVGALLRDARFQMGYTLEEVYRQTKILPQHLQAMELNRFTELPGGSYTQGYLRLYAEFLRLDETYVLERFAIEQRALHSRKNWFSAVVPVVGGKRPGRRLVVVCALLYLTLWWGWYRPMPEAARYERRMAVTQEAKVPQQPEPGERCFWQPSVGAPPKRECHAAASDAELSRQWPEAALLAVAKDSWLKLDAPLPDGRPQVFMDGLVQAGERYRLPIRRNLRITTSQDEGVMLFFAGKEYQPKVKPDSGRQWWGVPLDELVPLPPLPKPEPASAPLPAAATPATSAGSSPVTEPTR